MRGKGEDVRRLLVGKEGWKRTCPPGTTSPMLRLCVSLCGSTKPCSEPAGQEPSGTSCPHGNRSGHPHSLAGAVGKSWRRRGGV